MVDHDVDYAIPELCGDTCTRDCVTQLAVEGQVGGGHLCPARPFIRRPTVRGFLDIFTKTGKRTHGVRSACHVFRLTI